MAHRATLPAMFRPVSPVLCFGAALVVVAGAPALAATGADADAESVRVLLRAATATLDTGPLPAGVSAFAPLDYEISAVARESSLTVGSLATLATGPLRAGVRGKLAGELSEASAAAQAFELKIGGALGIVLAIDGAASTAFAHCKGGTPRTALDAELAGATLDVLGLPVSIGANPQPNTVVPLALAGARLVLNEQRTGDGSASVNALRLTLENVALGTVLSPLLVDGEVVVSHAQVSLAGCGRFIDSDLDGIDDDADTCPSLPGVSQRDTDGDGAGDACDDDDDADLVLDAADSCPLEANPAQGPCVNSIFESDFEN